MLAVLFASALAAASPANRYVQTNLVANKDAYKPTISTDPRLVNAWGIAIRPAGMGGHFWVTGKDISFEYVGDVQASKDPKLRTLFTDELATITLPVGGADQFATGVTYSDSLTQFVITQTVKGAAPITAPAKFLFASDGGIISAWTERKRADGGKDFPSEAITVIDQSKDGAQFFGLTMGANYGRLYVADFGKAPAIKVFNGRFLPSAILFDQPFDENKNGRVDAGEYAPFNVQAVTLPGGKNRIFVAYTKTQTCTADGARMKQCEPGTLFAGEEDTSKPGHGRLAEFTEQGALLHVWEDRGKLSAPWGIALAPSGFGALSGHLLVSNFGDGTIAAFDPATRRFKDVMRDAKGQPIAIDKIWGLLFGNGASLGDANALYFAAGPKDETDGIFGSLRVAP